MKKLLLLLLPFFILGNGVVKAQDPVVSITTKIANQGSYVTGYDKEFKLIDPGSDLTWTVRNFNNNNSAWDNIRCGSKTAATTATITTDFAIASPITKVDVEVSRYKTGESNRMTSMTLLVSPNANMSDSTAYPVDISNLPATTGTPVTLTIPVAEPEENMYYQLSIEMPKVFSEGVFSVNSLEYYTYDRTEEEGVHAVTLDFTDKESTLAAYIGEGTIAPGGEYAETATNNLNGASFAVGDVGISISKEDGTITPRWWESKTITPELRLNPDNVMTIEMTKERCRILEVKFLQGNVNTSYYDALDSSVVETSLGESELKDKTWSAPEEEVVDRMTLVFKDYCRCGSIRIIYFEEKEEEEEKDSIDTVSFNVENGNLPIGYFNLQGVKVADCNLVPGIYIVRRGSEVAKVFVK